MEALGRAIRARRGEVGLTLAQAAMAVGCAKGYLSEIENGRRANPPSEALLARIERALRMRRGELVRLARWSATPGDVKREVESLRRGADAARRLAELVQSKGLDGAHRSGELQALVGRLAPAADVDLQPLPVQVPLINRVAAGYPTEFTDLDYPARVADEYVSTPDLYDAQAFAARVVGDSMAPEYRERFDAGSVRRAGVCGARGGRLDGAGVPRGGDRGVQSGARHPAGCGLLRAPGAGPRVHLQARLLRSKRGGGGVDPVAAAEQSVSASDGPPGRCARLVRGGVCAAVGVSGMGVASHGPSGQCDVARALWARSRGSAACQRPSHGALGGGSRPARSGAHPGSAEHARIVRVWRTPWASRAVGGSDGRDARPTGRGGGRAEGGGVARPVRARALWARSRGSAACRRPSHGALGGLCRLSAAEPRRPRWGLMPSAVGCASGQRRACPNRSRLADSLGVARGREFGRAGRPSHRKRRGKSGGGWRRTARQGSATWRRRFGRALVALPPVGGRATAPWVGSPGFDDVEVGAAAARLGERAARECVEGQLRRAGDPELEQDLAEAA